MGTKSPVDNANRKIDRMDQGQEIISYQQYVRPLYVMAKPAGARCNLRCTYCYYLEKSKLYATAPSQSMSDSTLECFVRDYIAAQPGPNVVFSWHGGETLLRTRAFYERVVALQQRYGQGRHIENSIQTNGTLLNDDWCAFFREQGWLVGISIDGPRAFHDAYRTGVDGRPSFDEVMRGITLLQKHQVEWNALAVVNRLNGDHPREFYRFFREMGCRYLQFTPVVERIAPHNDGRTLAAVSEQSGQLADFSVTPEQWGRFTSTLFDEWVVQDVGRLFVQLFDATLANWVGQAPGICTLSKSCGHAGALEFNGDLYACDHFVFPEYRIGNILETPLSELMHSARQVAFGDAKIKALPRQCRQCRYLFACNGECPRNRFARTKEGEANLNYLCKGYQRFFAHVEPYMDFMRNEYLHGRAPANVMSWAQARFATKGTKR